MQCINTPSPSHIPRHAPTPASTLSHQWYWMPVRCRKPRPLRSCHSSAVLNVTCTDETFRVSEISSNNSAFHEQTSEGLSHSFNQSLPERTCNIYSVEMEAMHSLGEKEREREREREREKGGTGRRDVRWKLRPSRDLEVPHSTKQLEHGSGQESYPPLYPEI